MRQYGSVLYMWVSMKFLPHCQCTCTRCWLIYLTCGKSVVKEKPDSSVKEHPNNKKVKNMKKVEFENSNQHWKKHSPGPNLTRRRKLMFCIVCRKYPTVADKASRLYVGINGSSATGFRLDSLVSHVKSHSHYFCFQRTKMKKNQRGRRCSKYM